MKIIVRKFKVPLGRPRSYWEGCTWSARRHRAELVADFELWETLEGLRRIWGKEAELEALDVAPQDETRGCCCRACREIVRQGR